MACRMDRVLLEEYVDGMLTKLEKLLVEEHIKTCTSCRKQLTEMKLLFWEIENIAHEEIEIPKELVQVGEKLINEFVESKALDRTKEVLRKQADVASSVFGYLNNMPLTKQVKKSLGKTARKLPGLTLKAYEKLKPALLGSKKNRLKQATGGTS